MFPLPEPVALENLPPPPEPLPVPPAPPLLDVVGEKLGAAEPDLPATPVEPPPIFGAEVTGAVVGCAICGIADFGIGILKLDDGLTAGFGTDGVTVGFGA